VINDLKQSQREIKKWEERQTECDESAICGRFCEVE
jgi:hypothetical protein